MKRVKKEFIPYTVSIYEMCKKVDKLDYFKQIRNRILWLVEEHELLGDYVRVSPNSSTDLFLCDDGICVFSEILIGYFGEKYIYELRDYLQALNAHKRVKFDIEQLYSSLTAEQLRQSLNEYIALTVDDSKGEEVRQAIIQRIRAELKKRKGLKYKLSRINTRVTQMY